jgi:spore cortex formation protein SpoVR/YcgB (stage V sporulation)
VLWVYLLARVGPGMTGAGPADASCSFGKGRAVSDTCQKGGGVEGKNMGLVNNRSLADVGCNTVICLRIMLNRAVMIHCATHNTFFREHVLYRL